MLYTHFLSKRCYFTTVKLYVIFSEELFELNMKITVLNVDSIYRIEFYTFIFWQFGIHVKACYIYIYGVNKVVSQLWTNMWQSKKICSIPIQDFCVNRRFEISNLDLQFRFISTFLSKIHDMFYIFGGKRSCLQKLYFYLTFSEELFEFNRHLLCWLFIWNIESNYTIQFFNQCGIKFEVYNVFL